ncbi:MAG: D-2-hydroxyacid dehydrogenase [Gudongella sp.]|jgi:D-3-phosphoglycerate dehydrogenase|nr:D-2-hydroxyacid dehydrogenase [Gudongella sp.]
MLKILATDGIDSAARESLESMGHAVTEKFFELEELKTAVTEYDIIVVRSATKVRKPILDAAHAAGKLKMVIRAGVGIDNIDAEYAESLGIKVRNTPNSSSASVAELALAHMLSLARFVGIANVTMREGQWNKKAYTGTELSGKTLGLIGFGRISIELAKKAEALGMKILYTNRRGPREEYPDYKYAELDELLRTSDFVSIHTPAMPDGKALIGAEELSLMKKSSFIINCARGGIIDERALLEALQNELISGAGIDVFEEEPAKNIELISHPRVSVTPHIGGSTAEAQERIGGEIVDIIKSNF